MRKKKNYLFVHGYFRKTQKRGLSVTHVTTPLLTDTVSILRILDINLNLQNYDKIRHVYLISARKPVQY